MRDKVFSLGLGVNPGESPVRCLRATVAPGDTLPLARRGMLVTLFQGWHVMNIDHTLIAYHKVLVYIWSPLSVTVYDRALSNVGT